MRQEKTRQNSNMAGLKLEIEKLKMEVKKRDKLANFIGEFGGTPIAKTR
jgi:hypothetical protein